MERKAQAAIRVFINKGFFGWADEMRKVTAGERNWEWVGERGL
jgi:hypothetical protein